VPPSLADPNILDRTAFFQSILRQLVHQRNVEQFIRCTIDLS
jgi:hypothetical protein